MQSLASEDFFYLPVSPAVAGAENHIQITLRLVPVPGASTSVCAHVLPCVRRRTAIGDLDYALFRAGARTTTALTDIVGCPSSSPSTATVSSLSNLGSSAVATPAESSAERIQLHRIAFASKSLASAAAKVWPTAARNDRITRSADAHSTGGGSGGGLSRAGGEWARAAASKGSQREAGRIQWSSERPDGEAVRVGGSDSSGSGFFHSFSYPQEAVVQSEDGAPRSYGKDGEEGIRRPTSRGREMLAQRHRLVKASSVKSRTEPADHALPEMALKQLGKRPIHDAREVTGGGEVAATGKKGASQLGIVASFGRAAHAEPLPLTGHANAALSTRWQPMAKQATARLIKTVTGTQQGTKRTISSVRTALHALAALAAKEAESLGAEEARATAAEQSLAQLRAAVAAQKQNRQAAAVRVTAGFSGVPIAGAVTGRSPADRALLPTTPTSTTAPAAAVAAAAAATAAADQLAVRLAAAMESTASRIRSTSVQHPPSAAADLAAAVPEAAGLVGLVREMEPAAAAGSGEADRLAATRLTDAAAEDIALAAALRHRAAREAARERIAALTTTDLDRSAANPSPEAPRSVGRLGTDAKGDMAAEGSLSSDRP